MKIKMELLSDAIFGNGMSVPGGEDISVLADEYGFPYYKGSTFKGVFRDELIKLLELSGKTDNDVRQIVENCMGMNGDDCLSNDHKIEFADFKLSGAVRNTVVSELKNHDDIFAAMTSLRTFTAMENETVKDGSLRVVRCVNRGLIFYSDVRCSVEDESLIEDVLGMIKWIGRMKNRGFGKVRICKVEEGR